MTAECGTRGGLSQYSGPPNEGPTPIINTRLFSDRPTITRTPLFRDRVDHRAVASASLAPRVQLLVAAQTLRCSAE